MQPEKAIQMENYPENRTARKIIVPRKRNMTTHSTLPAANWRFGASGTTSTVSQCIQISSYNLKINIF